MNELAQLDDTLECCNLSLGLFLSKVRGGMIPQLYYCHVKLLSRFRLNTLVF